MAIGVFNKLQNTFVCTVIILFLCLFGSFILLLSCMYVLSKTLHNAYIEHMIGFKCVHMFVLLQNVCMCISFYIRRKQTNKQLLLRGFDGVMILTMCTYYNLFPTYHPSICLTPKIAVLRFSNTFKR